MKTVCTVICTAPVSIWQASARARKTAQAAEPPLKTISVRRRTRGRKAMAPRREGWIVSRTSGPENMKTRAETSDGPVPRPRPRLRKAKVKTPARAMFMTVDQPMARCVGRM